jgi:DNA-binding response OmpR family regulator
MEKVRGRILCVDDHQDTCEMLAALLGLDGFEVTQTNNIADALSAATSNDFDLILLDWVLKDGSGIDLCKALASTHSTTPILFYSGIAGKSEMDAAMQAGAQGFLIKPVDVEDLLQSVSRFVDSETGQSQGGKPN